MLLQAIIGAGFKAL
jgi:hypothetical protein